MRGAGDGEGAPASAAPLTGGGAGVTGRAYYQAKLDADATLAGLLDGYRTAAARCASEKPGSTVGA